MPHLPEASSMLDGQELGQVRKLTMKLVLPSEKASLPELSQMTGF